MTRYRLALINTAIVVLIGSHLLALISKLELWPISHYPMYSRLATSTVVWHGLWGVTQEGEVALPADIYFAPFRTPRINNILLMARTVEEQNDALRQLWRRYDELRGRGAHDGPPLLGLRAYRVAWALTPGVTKESQPLARKLMFEIEAGGLP